MSTPGSLIVPVTACHTAPMRFFNTEGPVRPDKHYCVPPLAQLDLDRTLTLIRREKYFVLHAPRQTGKAFTLLALRDLLIVWLATAPGRAAQKVVYDPTPPRLCAPNR